jgi:orotidine-5'-phosphate decarboxylase
MLTIFVGSPETAACYAAAMDAPFIHGRTALAEATDLMDRFGHEAVYEAAARAERSRDDGNVVRFCHWRHIQRVIATLSSNEVFGSVH